MASNIRSTPALLARVEKLRDDLLKRFQTLVSLSTVDNAKMDRNTTAITEYQMQVETAALIRSAEDFQALIRQLQEAWLFGQLNTIGDSETQQQTDDSAKQVTELLRKISGDQTVSTDDAMNGD